MVVVVVSDYRAVIKILLFTCTPRDMKKKNHNRRVATRLCDREIGGRRVQSGAVTSIIIHGKSSGIIVYAPVFVMIRVK